MANMLVRVKHFGAQQKLGLIGHPRDIHQRWGYEPNKLGAVGFYSKKTMGTKRQEMIRSASMRRKQQSPLR
jgi:hypothetical protein